MTPHTPHFSGMTWRFAKIIFYFIRGDQFPESTAKTIGPRYNTNIGDKEGLQIPCSLQLVGKKKFVEVLKKEFSKMGEL